MEPLFNVLRNGFDKLQKHPKLSPSLVKFSFIGVLTLFKAFEVFDSFCAVLRF